MRQHRLVAGLRAAVACAAVTCTAVVGAVAAAPTTAALPAADREPPSASPSPSAGPVVTPYPGAFVDLYRDPAGQVDGASYIWPEVADLRERIGFDLPRLRRAGVNTVGLYDVEKLSDATKDRLFAELERGHQKAVIRIERYDRCAFAFDATNAAHTDAEDVVARYTRDDPAHARTGLLPYLIARGKLKDVAYFMINLPVDDPNVTRHFVTAEYPDGRANPRWAASQLAYVDYLVPRLRSALGAAAPPLYLGIFYGWDYSYQMPDYASVAHPADGYSFTNYTYPAAEPPGPDAAPSTLINAPRLQQGMDKLMSQYPTQPKIVEYGFHTVEYNQGVKPGQTAGLVADLAAKRLALPATTAFYRDGSSGGRPFNVRGTLYFAENLYKAEGVPPTLNDWTLTYPDTGRLEAEDPTVARFYRAGELAANAPTPVQAAADAEAAAASHAPDPVCPATASPSPSPSSSPSPSGTTTSGTTTSGTTTSGTATPGASAPTTGGATAASGGSVALRVPGEAVQFFDLGAAPRLDLQYRSATGATVTVLVDGAAPTVVRLAPSRTWTTATLSSAVNDQSSVRLVLQSRAVDVDWLAGRRS